MVALSGSSTGLVVIMAALVLIPIAAMLKGQIHLAMAVGSAALLLGGIAGALFLSYPAKAFELVGRDATLTGRTDLWLAVIEFIAARPLLGYGYQAFWFGEDVSADVKEIAGWVGASAHNGFLDLTLALGVVGATVFGIGLLICMGRAALHLRRGEGIDGVWPLAFLLYFVLYNMTETSLLIPTDMLWAVYVAIVLSLRPVRQRSRVRVAGRHAAGRPRPRTLLRPQSNPAGARVPPAWEAR
jgi:exopolysaccharide production protein ExoQ